MVDRERSSAVAKHVVVYYSLRLSCLLFCGVTVASIAKKWPVILTISHLRRGSGKCNMHPLRRLLRIERQTCEVGLTTPII